MTHRPWPPRKFSGPDTPSRWTALWPSSRRCSIRKSGQLRRFSSPCFGVTFRYTSTCPAPAVLPTVTVPGSPCWGRSEPGYDSVALWPVRLARSQAPGAGPGWNQPNPAVAEAEAVPALPAEEDWLAQPNRAMDNAAVSAAAATVLPARIRRSLTTIALARCAGSDVAVAIAWAAVVVAVMVAAVVLRYARGLVLGRAAVMDRRRVAGRCLGGLGPAAARRHQAQHACGQHEKKSFGKHFGYSPSCGVRCRE